jgi:hypothetical protein
MTAETVRTPAPTPAEDAAAEELRLWADYYEAATQALEIVRLGGVTDATLARILTEHSRATRAIKRIREIHGLGD